MLSIWTVYDHPGDYPGHYVARRFVTDANGSTATSEVMISTNLNEIRTTLESKGLVRLLRSAEDDPTIMEVWL